ncbi:MAG: aminoacyl-histidine dipeptidase [Clostridia bacterium]|nr:aminoacyl-histidine dipeptidase [Clostridia bacterium]
MGVLSELNPQAVFTYFEALCHIPHGSGNMGKISDFCVEFAEKNGLWFYQDEANNVIIKKPASCGYEYAAPIILQGHLDMVCQKEEGSTIQFETDGIDLVREGDYIRAKGTTLGADNGIAVAMIMAILADKELSHPPIEAVFTTDEEIGMIGAGKLDMSVLQSKRMLNIDSEDPAVVTVSCAGGSDFWAHIPVSREQREGTTVVLTVKGLRGGHSGVEINSGRVNANFLMGRLLHSLSKACSFDIISIDGGDKGNAIPVSCTAKVLTTQPEQVIAAFESCAVVIRDEIKSREPEFSWLAETTGTGVADVMAKETSDKLLHTLLLAPNGVLEMSADIENLVETSLNMGILKTEKDAVSVLFALRSNKSTALAFLEEKLTVFFNAMGCAIKTGGHYPPWEYKNDSVLRDLYIEKYREKTDKTPRVEAIHAGLECGVFAAAIPDFDCISIGPEMHDIHTVKERLSINSTKEIYEIICRMLADLK